MDNTDNNKNLERMLRNWGVQEKMQETSLPPLPSRPRRSAGRSLRWACLSAAAVLLISIGIFADRWLLSPGVTHSKKSVMAAKVSPMPNGSTVDQEQLVETLAAKLDQTYKKLETQNLMLKQQVASTSRTAEQLQALRTQVAKIDELQKELASRNTQLARLQADISAMNEASLAQQKIIRNMQMELAQANKQNAQTYKRFVSAFVKSTALQERGIAAIQQEVWDRNLLDQLTKLRTDVKDSKVQESLDVLEVLLMRLSLLDVNDKDRVADLSRQIRRTGIIQRVGSFSQSDNVNQPLVQWMLEASLLLSGVHNAG